jgi:NhaA family Na+:H+ antiporter
MVGAPFNLKMVVPMVSKLLSSTQNFFRMEAASSLILLAAVILAFIIANGPLFEHYQLILEYKILSLSIHHWINDGLMTIFFFLVGLEIKKELVVGELSTPKKAAMPIFAAIGGMVFPALIYFFFNHEMPQAKGWGIPMATDIAFAVGVLTLFGRRVPVSMKIFLLAIAIVDDLGAILVIAFFYTQEIRGSGLALAMIAFGIMALFKFFKIKSYLVYLPIALVIWLGFLYSGVHATLAGVAIGLLTPITISTNKFKINPVDDLIHLLHPWVSFGIMPIFALANAGIRLSGFKLFEVLNHSVNQGIILGLCLGKPIGIFLMSLIAKKLKIANLPSGLNWNNVFTIGCLGGIGFTMSLFISSLALPSSLEVYSKTGIILASLISAIVGALLIKINLKDNND